MRVSVMRLLVAQAEVAEPAAAADGATTTAATLADAQAAVDAHAERLTAANYGKRTTPG